MCCEARPTIQWGDRWWEVSKVTSLPDGKHPNCKVPITDLEDLPSFIRPKAWSSCCTPSAPIFSFVSRWISAFLFHSFSFKRSVLLVYRRFKRVLTTIKQSACLSSFPRLHSLCCCQTVLTSVERVPLLQTSYLSFDFFNPDLAPYLQQCSQRSTCIH